MSVEGCAGSLPSTEIGTHHRGGRGGLASGGDCLRISDALTVTPTVPQQLGGVGVVSSFVHFL